VLDLLQHAALVVGVLNLLHLDHLGLLEHLDGIEALVVLALHEVDAAEAAGAERALDGEVGERVLALGDARLIERLRGELHGAALGRGRRAGRVGGVYQVLYARRVVRGRRLLGVRTRQLRAGGMGMLDVRRRLLLLLLLLLCVGGGVHRVGGLVLRGRGRAGVGLLGRVVRPGLVQMERARGALRGRWRQRRRAVDGRRRAIEVVGALRVLRPLLLEEAEGRHRSGAEERVLLLCSAAAAAAAALAVPGVRCGASFGGWASRAAAIGAVEVVEVTMGAGGAEGWGLRQSEGWLARCWWAGFNEAPSRSDRLSCVERNARVAASGSRQLHAPATAHGLLLVCTLDIYTSAACSLCYSRSPRPSIIIITITAIASASRRRAAGSPRLRHGLSSSIPALTGLLEP
jgi:hypothetical protein